MNGFPPVTSITLEHGNISIGVRKHQLLHRVQAYNDWCPCVVTTADLNSGQKGKTKGKKNQYRLINHVYT